MPFVPGKTSLSPKSEQNQEAQKPDPNAIEASSSMPEIEKAAQEVFSQLHGNRSVLQIEQSIHMGPLPPPDMMNAYDAATRKTILEMARAAQEHSHERDRAESAIARRGQWMSFIFSMSCLAGGFFLLHNGQILIGSGAGLVGIAIATRDVLLNMLKRIGSRKRKEKRD